MAWLRLYLLLKVSPCRPKSAQVALRGFAKHQLTQVRRFCFRLKTIPHSSSSLTIAFCLGQTKRQVSGVNGVKETLSRPLIAYQILQREI